VQVLVTGARGFVGQRLLPRLTAAGWRTRGIDREVDVTQAGALIEVVAESAPDAVVHLAALSFVPDSVRDPAASFRVNFLGTRHLLEAVRLHAPGARVLVVSTGHVYGAAPDHASFDESAPLRPDSPYARAKAAADLLARCYAERGLDVVRVRPFNHTGAGRPEQFVESSFARQIAEIAAGRRTPRLSVGNLEAVRDFLDVEDVVDAYLRLLDPAVPTGVYNVASGTGRSIAEVLDTLLELAGVGPRGAALEIAVDAARWRPADRAVGDASKLRATTGWSPRVDFRETLRAIFDGWRQGLSAA
jgi:GDP-4-dehydro-6-deoxy-D-mannose reductase